MAGCLLQLVAGGGAVTGRRVPAAQLHKARRERHEQEGSASTVTVAFERTRTPRHAFCSGYGLQRVPAAGASSRGRPFVLHTLSQEQPAVSLFIHPTTRWGGPATHQPLFYTTPTTANNALMRWLHNAAAAAGDAVDARVDKQMISIKPPPVFRWWIDR